MAEYRAARSHLGGKPVAKSLDCDLPRGRHACLLNQRQRGLDNSGQQPRSCGVVRAEMRLHAEYAQRPNARVPQHFPEPGPEPPPLAGQPAGTGHPRLAIRPSDQASECRW